jgi:hypothetical protein
MKSIALLGSNSHIAKGLLYNFLKQGKYNISLFTTGFNKTIEFYNFLDCTYNLNNDECSISIYNGYDSFLKKDYDVILNCIGVGASNKLKGNYNNFFTFPEDYDNLCIKYLQQNKECLYITFSSGAVYGKLDRPAEEDTFNKFQINNIQRTDYYSIARLYTEAKHRSLNDLNIVDLRVFSYFSRFMDFEDKYFITELIKAMRNDEEFKVVNDSFVRDYLHPDDLFQAISKCIDIKNLNNAFDITSNKSVTKEEILNYFEKNYGLRYKIEDDFQYNSASGVKGIYCSDYKNHKEINYIPEYSSMDTIIKESKYVLKGV